MTKIGDQIKVNIKGGTSIEGTIKVPKGESMSVLGTIVEDQGEYWLIELDLSVKGKNRLLVAKDARR